MEASLFWYNGGWHCAFVSELFAMAPLFCRSCFRDTSNLACAISIPLSSSRSSFTSLFFSSSSAFHFVTSVSRAKSIAASILASRALSLSTNSTIVRSMARAKRVELISFSRQSCGYLCLKYRACGWFDRSRIMKFSVNSRAELMLSRFLRFICRTNSNVVGGAVRFGCIEIIKEAQREEIKLPEQFLLKARVKVPAVGRSVLGSVKKPCQKEPTYERLSRLGIHYMRRWNMNRLSGLSRNLSCNQRSSFQQDV